MIVGVVHERLTYPLTLMQFLLSVTDFISLIPHDSSYWHITYILQYTFSIKRCGIMCWWYILCILMFI